MRKPKVIEAATDKAVAPELPTAAPRRPKGSKRTSAFDVALGTRIRTARVAAHMSQTVLGQAVGVSFQQVQKYELGKDRISASALQAFADALGVHPGSFFDESMSVPVGRSIFDVKRTFRSADVLGQIRDPRVLDRLLALAKVLAEPDGAEVEPAPSDGTP